MSIDPDGNGMSSPEASRILRGHPAADHGATADLLARVRLDRDHASGPDPQERRGGHADAGPRVNDDRPTHAPVQKSTHRLELG